MHCASHGAYEWLNLVRTRSLLEGLENVSIDTAAARTIVNTTAGLTSALIRMTNDEKGVEA